MVLKLMSTQKYQDRFNLQKSDYNSYIIDSKNTSVLCRTTQFAVIRMIL